MRRSFPAPAEIDARARRIGRAARVHLRRQGAATLVLLVGLEGMLAALWYGGFLSIWTPLAVLGGAVLNYIAAAASMRVATQACGRVAAASAEGPGTALVFAFRAAAVGGLIVASLALLETVGWLLLAYLMLRWAPNAVSLSEWATAFVGVPLGASANAWAARLNNGLATRSATEAAQRCADDAREDCDKAERAAFTRLAGRFVREAAGGAADFHATLSATIFVAMLFGVVSAAAGLPMDLRGEPEIVRQIGFQAAMLPPALTGLGVLTALVGVFWMRPDAAAEAATLRTVVARGVNLATALVVVFGPLIILLMTGGKDWGLAGALIVGSLLGWAAGKWQETAAAAPWPPSRKTLDYTRGPAPALLAGAATGFRSAGTPIALMLSGLAAAFLLAVFAGRSEVVDEPFRDPLLGFHGVGAALLGMLAVCSLSVAGGILSPIIAAARELLERSQAEPRARENMKVLSDVAGAIAADGRGQNIACTVLTGLALTAASVEAARQQTLCWAKQTLAADGAPGQWLARNIRLEARAGSPPQVRFESAVGAHSTPLASASSLDLAAVWQLHPHNPGAWAAAAGGSILALWIVGRLLGGFGQATAVIESKLRQHPAWTERDLAKAGAAAARGQLFPPLAVSTMLPLAFLGLFGVAGTVGLALGTATAAAPLGLVFVRAGQAWASLRRAVEGGAQGGLGSDAHRIALVCDQIGGPVREIAAPAMGRLLIWVGLLSVALAGLAARFTLF